jgi:hypothetical protein
LKRDGSIWAMSCPFFTGVLKSAYQASMRPETWLPTWTVTMAETVPLAVTFAARGPWSSDALW